MSGQLDNINEQRARNEVFAERLLVQKDVRVVELLVKPVLQLLHTTHNAVKVTVACYTEKIYERPLLAGHNY